MIFTGIVQLVVVLLRLILMPIDALISTALPSLETAFTAIGSLFTTISTVVGWGLSLLNISSFALNFIVAYYVFVLTVPIFVWTFKLVIRWYNKLKP